MAKPSKKSSRNKASPPAVELAHRLAPRRASAERRLRIQERLTSGLTVAHIARIENLTVHRIRQIIAGMLEKRELDQPVGFVQLRPLSRLRAVAACPPDRGGVVPPRSLAAARDAVGARRSGREIFLLARH